VGHLNLREKHLTIGEPRAIRHWWRTSLTALSQTIVTDETWKAGTGPILRNSVYLGEVYDARQEQPGWDRPGFDDAAGTHVSVARECLVLARAGRAPHPRHPARSNRSSSPSLNQAFIYFRLWQNFAGWGRLRVKGPAGTRVRLRYGELLYPDGTLNGMTSV